MIDGLVNAMANRGDERWIPQESCDRFVWTCSAEYGDHTPTDIDSWHSVWSSTVDEQQCNYEVLYLDINRDVEAWRPLLQEAQLRLEGKTSTSAIVRPGTAFFAHIQDLVPWNIHQAQIVRNPKVRRIPQNLMSQKPVTHRAAILRYNDGQINMESEEVTTFGVGRFETPVSYGILVYGEAPATSMNPEEEAQPGEPISKPKKKVKTDGPDLPQPGEETGLPRQPGYRDITFDVQEGSVPKWVQNALRRLHTNLGHPANESLVRHLAQAGATGQALLGAKHLRCSVCERTKTPHQPRPSKIVQARRFNDRVFLDIVFIKNVNGETFPYLNILDDASTYQILDHLPDRSETVVVQKLVDGWFRYFGPPLSMVVDAEGALRGFNFENLVAQCGIQLRFVPPDAHWQLGKCERHGQACKWIARRLINQFAALSREEMDLVINMAVHAKNSLVRRCGASPCQWVFGRQPRVPSSLLSEPEAVEAKSMVDNNDALLQVEMVRHEAMKAFADYEFNQALRRAMLRKGRPYRGPLEVGQKIAYYRHRTQLDGEGTVEGYRQGMIIGLDPGPTGSVWIRNTRGRVVQAAREQVRSVEGEELWSPSTEDIKALKDTETDLSQKHPHAFDHRSSAPSALADQDVSAVLDAAGQVQQSQGDVPPVLVAIPPMSSEPSRKASQSLSEITIPASQQPQRQPETPVIYLPPTPALPAPGTPGMMAVPALPPIPEEDEPNSLLKLENVRSQPTSTVTTTKQGTKRGSDVQPEALRDQSHIPSSSARGTKRDAEQDTSALHEQDRMKPRPESQVAGVDPMHAILSVYCKYCGTHETTFQEKHQCPRCSSAEFVQDPKLVENWFDEVEEHEAMMKDAHFAYDPHYKRWLDKQTPNDSVYDLPRDQQLDDTHDAEAYLVGVGQMFSQLPENALAEETSLWSVAVKTPDQTGWRWTQLFDQLSIDEDVVTNQLHQAGKDPPGQSQTVFIKHWRGNRRKSRKPSQQPEHRFLQRHGRHCVHLAGWDGSNPELQPAFQNDNFFQAYYALCDDVVKNAAMVSSEEEMKLMQEDVNRVKKEGLHHVLASSSSTTPDTFSTATDQVFHRPESSDEEEDANQTSGRAAKQALKREIPWRSIASEDWPAFVESLRDEWKEWETWSSCQPVELREGEVDPSLILKSRVCYRWKPKDGGKWFKAKARIVIQGYRDPHLPLLTRDSPVLSKTCFILIIQWSASHGVSLYNADCKSAFLQGLPDVERPTAIYMRPPQDAISLEVNFWHKTMFPLFSQKEKFLLEKFNALFCFVRKVS